MLEYCVGTNKFLEDAINQIKYGILDKLGRHLEGKNIDAIHYSLYPDIYAYTDALAITRKEIANTIVYKYYKKKYPETYGYNTINYPHSIEALFVDEIVYSKISFNTENYKGETRVVHFFYWKLAELIDAHTD